MIRPDGQMVATVDLDAEERKRVFDAAPIEDLLDALVRRSERACAVARTAYYQAELEEDAARQVDLSHRCEASARLCRSVSHAMHTLAPMSPQDQRALDLSLEAAAMAAFAVPRTGRVGHA